MESPSEQEIVGSYKKGFLKLVIFFLPVVLLMVMVSIFGRGINPWTSIKPLISGLLFYYAVLSGYISINPKWIWDISYLRMRLSAVKPEPTKFYFTAVRIVMLIVAIVSLFFGSLFSDR